LAKRQEKVLSRISLKYENTPPPEKLFMPGFWGMMVPKVLMVSAALVVFLKAQF